MTPPPSSLRDAAGAWLVHAFTATGAAMGLFALMAVVEGRHGHALIWLLAALVVDGVDGSLARSAQVATRLPRIDGNVLDLVIDYLNYVFVPAVLIWRAELVPTALAAPLGAVILISALYCFARSDMKTEDNYFRGFPALWNVVAFYLFVARPGPEAGAALVLLFAILTFAPVHVVHPLRVRDYGRWPAAIAFVWAIATTALLYSGWSDDARIVWLAGSGMAAAALLLMGLARTFRGPA